MIFSTPVFITGVMFSAMYMKFRAPWFFKIAITYMNYVVFSNNLPTSLSLTIQNALSLNYRVRSFKCYDQLLCMAFAQLTYRESLWDIECCLRAMREKLHQFSFKNKWTACVYFWRTTSLWTEPRREIECFCRHGDFQTRFLKTQKCCNYK